MIQYISVANHDWLRHVPDAEWPSILSEAVADYNDSRHSTIQMTPNEAWEDTFCLDLTTLSEEKLITRSDVIIKLRQNIMSRLGAERDRMLKGKHVDFFDVGQTVLVRVPDRFRTKMEYLWGRKGEIVEEQRDSALH